MARRSIEEIRKREIIDAFFKVVAEKGLIGATTREIAVAAECNHGMLRHYFGSKEAVIIEAVDYLSKEYMAEIKKGMEKIESSAGIIEYLFNLFRLESIDSSISQVWLELLAFSRTNPKVKKAFQLFYQNLTGIVADIIRTGIQSGEFRTVDCDIIAGLICGSLEGQMLFVHIDAHQPDSAKMNDQLSRIFLHYLSKNG